MAEDRQINYSIVLNDRVSDQTKVIGDSAKKADVDVKELTASEERLNAEAKQTNATIAQQKIDLVSQLAVIMSVRESFGALSGGIIAMGLVSDETAESLMKVNAGLQILGGMATMVKTVQLAMETFNLSVLKNAILNTYNATISNPGRAVLTGVAVGTAVGAGVALGGYFLNQHNNNTTNQTTITVEKPSEGDRQMVNELWTVTGMGDGI